MPKAGSLLRITAVLVAASGLAAPLETRAQQPVDPAMEALRQRVRAEDRKREEAFDKLRAIPVPAPVPNLLVEIAPAQNGDDQDEDAPTRLPFASWEAYEQWVFLNVSTTAVRRTHLDKLLSARIEKVDQRSRLDPDQKAMLLLAGRGDIKHLFDRIGAERRAYELAVSEGDRAAAQQVVRNLMPLRLAFQEGPFMGDSLFAKTLNRIRDGEPNTQEASAGSGRSD